MSQLCFQQASMACEAEIGVKEAIIDCV